MFARLLFLFIVVPVAELYLLVQVGSRIGLMPTLGLIVLTGFVGATLARWQGLSILSKIQNELRSGRPPALEMLEGAMIVIGGIVLLTPGILTDLFGFSLLVPGIRKSLAKKIQNNFSKSFTTFSPHSKSSNFKRPDDDVIDV